MRKVACVFGFIAFLPFSVLAAGKAGLVIQNSTGEVITRCVEFDEEAIAVDELLERSGFKLITEQKTWGTSINFIHDDGVQAGESHPDGWFWNFYQHDGTNWVMSDVGVTTAQATDGTIFGFVFGAWDAVQPPQKTFADVCEITSIAGLVIDHSDGSRTVRSVQFFGETVTGYQLLQKSGLDYIASEQSWGVAICSIDGEGMPSDDCFNDPEGRYWGLNILDETDTWISSPVGASDTIVYEGDVHGYLYGVWGTVQPSIMREEALSQTSNVAEWANMK